MGVDEADFMKRLPGLRRLKRLGKIAEIELQLHIDFAHSPSGS
jgi:hypothetical protein